MTIAVQKYGPSVWFSAILFIVAFWLVPSLGFAQQPTGTYVSECIDHDADSTIELEIVTCIYGNKTRMDAYVQLLNNSGYEFDTIYVWGGVYSGSDLSNKVLELPNQGSYDNNNGWSITSAGHFTPQVGTVYTLIGEFYDGMSSGSAQDETVKLTDTTRLAMSTRASSPSVYGTALTFFANTSDGPTGTVTFYDNGVAIGSGQIIYSAASYTSSTLGAGTHNISASWPGNSIYNAATSDTLVQTIVPATPTITWSAPAAITYGTALSATQLNATANVAGTFAYSPASGAIPGGGSQTLSVTFTPSDTADYNAVTASVPLSVSKATPTISWSAPAAITYGTALSTTQLNATANVAGTFAYSPASGAIPGGGAQTLSVTFTPSDTADYNAVTASVPLSVSKATPTIAWSAPAAITYGTALSTTQLNATANLAGTLTYTPGAGTVLDAGSHTLSVSLVPNDSSNYNSRSVSVSLWVNKATPSITWAPEAITYGTALSVAQLNATASVAGTFAYTTTLRETLIPAGIPAGNIDKVIGNGTSQYAGDGEPYSSTNVELYTPDGVVVDTSGNIYISEAGSGRIRKVTTSTGIITTVAGNGAEYSGDGGLATSAGLHSPFGLAVDTSGDIYIVDFYRVRKVTASTGIITTVAGNGTAGYSGDGGLATDAQLYSSTSVAVDASGNIYIADYGNARIRKVTASTGKISTVAGNGSCSYFETGGQATSAPVCNPRGVAVDASGNIYIAETGDNRILKVTTSTGIITTVAGDATLPGGYSGDGNQAIGARLNSPTGVAVDTSGNIDIVDKGNNRIRMVSASTGTISTVAGNGTMDYSGDGGVATSAELKSLGSVAVDALGNIYIADDNRIRAVGTTNEDLSTKVPAMGTMLAAGTQMLSVNFTPTDANAENYTEATSTVTLTVNKAVPTITWATPAPIVRGTALSATQLNAEASVVAGTLAYNPASGTVLTDGLQALSVTFIPTSENYVTATDTVTLTVNKPTPTLSLDTTDNKSGPVTIWAMLSSGLVGAPFPSGTITFYDGGNSIGTVTISGTTAKITSSVLTTGTHTITASYSGDTNYNAVTASSISLTVGQATPTINWPTPADIAYGVPLSATQLNATASYNGISVSGTFEYTPAAGEILSPGTEELMVIFYPDNTDAYNTVVASVPLTVKPSSDPDLPIYSYSIRNSSGASGYAANGNILNYTDSVTGMWSSLAYDSLNRLSAGTQTPIGASAQSFCWSYDSFGNRTAQATSNQPFANAVGAAACQTASGENPTTNIWASYTASNHVYSTNASGTTVLPISDTAGNMTYDGVSTYLYDGEGRICAVKNQRVAGTYSMTQYIYDAEGARIAKGTITNWAAGCDTTQNGFVPTNFYVLGPSNEQLTETDGQGNWIHTNAYAAGMIVATYDLPPSDQPLPPALPVVALHFQLEDWLGTRRVQTDISGNPEESFSSLPFGDGLATTPASGAPLTADDATEHHYTGKERDTESGNDYFGARYYASTMGRFMSPDWSTVPVPIPFADITNPQSLNLYSYVGNDPLTRLDSDGHVVVDKGITYVPYSVTGATADEAIANANTHFNGQFAGMTTPSFQVNFQPTMSVTDSGENTKATLTAPSDDKVTTTLSQTIQLPSWKSSDPAEQAAFDKSTAQLKGHEETHAADNRAVAETLDKSIPGTSASATSKNPQNAVNAASTKLNSKLGDKIKAAESDSAQRAKVLDDKTNHGRNP
jgi:RHS repeat-associated protein